MAILTKDGKAAPFHGDHHPVSVVQGRKSRNLLDPAARYDTYANVRFHYPRLSTDGLTLRAGKTYTLVVFPGNYERPSGVYLNRNIEPYKTENLAKKYDSYSVSFTPTTDVENVSTDAYWGAGHEPSDVSAVKIMLFEGVGDVPYEPYGTVTDTIFKPTNLKKSGTTLTFERSYNHQAEVEVAGKSEQVQLTGKNLLEGYVTSGNLWSVSVTYEDDPYTATGKRMKVTNLPAEKNRLYIGKSQYPYDKLVAGKTYTVSLKVKASRDFGVSVFPFCEASGTRTTVAKPLNTEWQQISMTFEFLSGTQYAALYLIYPSWGGATFTEDDAVYFADIQLEESTSATPYEPYCGGIPAPNPDYPMPIVSVTEPAVGSRGRNGENATRTIDLQGHELRSLPDGTRDEVRVKRDGSVELVQRVVEIFGADCNWARNTTFDTFTRLVCTPSVPIESSSATETAVKVLSDKFVGSSYAADRETPGVCFQYTDNRLFCNPTYVLNTQAQVNAWVMDNNPVFLCKLVESVTIPLPSIDPLPTYYPYTFIDGNGNDISASVLVLPEE